ncbi:MAG: nuclear transport factor 2 family protein, partial [Bacteroidota bacterium]
KDSIFWEAYNNCDISTFATFIADDMEFYHDKAGITEGGEVLLAGVRKGLCGEGEPRLRREEVSGTVSVFPMGDYGAIISGEHLFYVTIPGKEEFLDGRARFFHLWRYQNGEWRMTRVMSYDHGPASKE